VAHEFDIEDIDMIVDARLEEIFELVHKELQSIGRASKLPGGVVLTGGGSLMPGIDEYAKQALQLSARVGKPSGFGGVADQIESPAFAGAVGLMLVDLHAAAQPGPRASKNGGGPSKVGDTLGNVTDKLTGIFNKFRS
jgi:cell division protein FtsA